MQRVRRGRAAWGRRVPGRAGQESQRDPGSSLSGSRPVMRLLAQTAAPFWDLKACWRRCFRGRGRGGAARPPRPPPTRLQTRVPGRGRAQRGQRAAGRRGSEPQLPQPVVPERADPHADLKEGQSDPCPHPPRRHSEPAAAAQHGAPSDSGSTQCGPRRGDRSSALATSGAGKPGQPDACAQSS